MTNTTIKLCVFDMAGTTVDEDNVVYKTVRQVIADQGYDLTLEQVLAQGAGKEKHQAITDVLAAETDCKDIASTADAAFALFKPALTTAYQQLEVKPITGVPALITQLRTNGIAVVLNTGYSREIATALLAKLDWQVGRDIDGLITADDVENGRPAPDMIEQAMQQCSIADRQAVLKAGDSIIDVEEGKNASCGVTIGVLSGAQTREQLETANPTYILDSLADLPPLLGLS